MFVKTFSSNFLRKYSTKIKPKITPDSKMIEEIDKNVYKPRNHPGVLRPRVVTIPDNIIKAIHNVSGDYPVKSLVADGDTLVQHLRGRHPPMEQNELKKTMIDVQDRVSHKLRNFHIASEKDEVRYKQTCQNNVNEILKKEVYNWKPVNYDAYNSLVYLFGRAVPDYAVLVKIFAELSERDPEFQPRSLLDFGSGVGTVTWAANTYWQKHIFEYFNVDSSVHMNDLAQILLQGGRGNKHMLLKGVFFRQFLPSSNTTYDLVVSAFSLLELPSRQARLETILKLWNKTQKYFIVVEHGTNVGFKIVNEVRDFILHTKNTRTTGHVFSPCPHDDLCPRYLADDGTPCNFEIQYFTLPIGRLSEHKTQQYSYMVIKKGERSENDLQWPRIIRPTLVRSKHSICRICTKKGQLEEVIFTASKHGKTMYHCARSTKLGDLLPIQIENGSEEPQGEPHNEET